MVQNDGIWMLDAGYWMLDAGFWFFTGSCQHIVSSIQKKPPRFPKAALSRKTTIDERRC
jgi:hypothetical protein